MQRILLRLLVLLMVMAPGISSADALLDVQAELGAGADSNPKRITGAGVPSDGFWSALVRAKGTLTDESFRLSATLTEAGRIYLGVSEATAGASRLDATARLSLTPRWAAGATINASDLTERGGNLDQNSLHGDASLTWDSDQWGASLAAGWTVFAPRAAVLRPFLASGPEAWLRPYWAPTAKHLLSAGYGIWRASYSRWTEIAPAERRDLTQTTSVEYAYRGSFLAALGYAYSWNRSDTQGGAFERHRLSARGAAFLPLDFTLAAQASLQWSHYPDPLFLTEQSLLAKGQENQNTLEVRLTHPLGKGFEFVVAFACYGSETVQASSPAPSYSRTVMSAALGWRGGWTHHEP